MPNGVTISMEPLGTAIVAGVSAVGRKTTTTRPPGSALGNDRPVTTVSEMWTDPQTNVEVQWTTSGPTGVNTMTMKNYSDAEPDPALFQIPAGYQVVDETGSFKVVLPR